MPKSFYHFLMRYRHPQGNDELAKFANNAYKDHSFPTQSVNYDEISRYLELNGHYLPSMTIFDDAWDLYLQIEFDKR
ncbi:YozE family protein [Bacillus kwashiorkori]|uniref:YozE family protein n=1 Tax=Bacillus kwashiorkori TaxID=1522318 RepID=UPI000784C46E|nr:YozE family protein [Bacillus kwashiorkori]